MSDTLANQRKGLEHAQQRIEILETKNKDESPADFINNYAIRASLRLSFWQTREPPSVHQAIDTTLKSFVFLYLFFYFINFPLFFSFQAMETMTDMR